MSTRPANPRAWYWRLIHHRWQFSSADLLLLALFAIMIVALGIRDRLALRMATDISIRVDAIEQHLSRVDEFVESRRTVAPSDVLRETRKAILENRDLQLDIWQCLAGRFHCRPRYPLPER